MNGDRDTVREPQAAAWGFYPFNKGQLVKELERAFTNTRFGPGALPSKKQGELTIIGGVVPHAGYSYSASCAAWFYKELAENKPAVETVILLGTNHTGFGKTITTSTYYTTWATPLGGVNIDVEFINKLKKEYPPLDDDALAHTREHSLEVQLPFLQYVYGDKFRIVPIVVKDLIYQEARDFAEALKRVVDDLKRDVIVIASSDFTHHGSIYGYVLFNSNISQNVRELDRKFIDAIIELDTRRFLKLIEEYNATVCGFGAIAIAMEYTKLLNGKAKLLKYYHSADVTEDEDVVVGYASILFYK
ncbi:MAG: AmmeMemoRadiSam system protein B [Ignisphaera sp.]